MGAVMLIGIKSSHNHCLILCFFHQIFIEKVQLENKLKLLHIIKSNILLYKFSKYEIIPLTFGLSKVV